MKSVVIFAAGGFGRQVLEIFRDCNKISNQWDIVGFIDDDETKHGSLVNGCHVLGGLKWLQENKNRYDSLGCVCAVGTPETRKKVTEAISGLGIEFYSVTHPSVIMSDFVDIGDDVVISPNSILTVNVKVGNHVQIGNACIIAHDCIIENYCRLGPRSAINGTCYIGQGTYIGSGATIIENTSVGEWSIVGAGATVTEDVPSRVVAVGVPAKVIKDRPNIHG
ncbi:acetyltransferase [Chloroflexota bacterium]